MHWLRSGRVALLWVALFTSTSVAEEKFGNSLDWVPADAAIYSASLHWKDQVEIVAGSNAWKKFREVPSIAMAWQLAEGQINDPNGPAALALTMMELPENQQAIQVLGDMFSDELVFYAGPKTIDCIELYSMLNGANTFARLEGAQEDGEGRQQNQARYLLETLQENRELLKTPDMVFAFKMADPAAATTQLKRLEVLARLGLKQTPIGNQFKRQTIGKHEYLTLSLDGSLVPWDQIPWDQYEEEEGEFSELRKTLEAMTIVVSLGVRDNYLIISINDSADHLAKLGEGPSLGSVKEFAPLAKFKDRKIVSLGYLSQTLAERLGYNAKDIEGIVEQAGGLLEMAGVEDASLRDRIAGDIERMGDDLTKYIPKPGAAMSFAFMTPNGFEGFSYNWAENTGLDGSQPLGLTQHVGGNPLLAIISRSKYDPQGYDLLVKWSKVGFGYFEEYAVPTMNADEREKFAQGMEIAKPLLARAEKATRDLLMPSMKDGQAALVLDAQSESKQWHKDMPASKEAMPMAELALVVSVSDMAKFKAAFAEYRAIADTAVEKIREKNPSAIPADYRIPDPETKSLNDAELYTYQIPAEAGLDKQFAPTGGIGKNVAVLTTSPTQAERILTGTPLGSNGLLSTGGAKPAAVAVFFNWPALVSAATPWIEFAIRENAPGAKGAAAEEDPAQVTDILSQVRSGLEILKCWQLSEAVTTIEDGVTISHSITTFRDVD